MSVATFRPSHSPTRSFQKRPQYDIYNAYRSILSDEKVRSSAVRMLGRLYSHQQSNTQISTPLAAILAMTELVEKSDGQ